MKHLSRNFFNQNTLKVAQQLLGKFLIRKINSKKIMAMITETEAYHGPKDLASHASRGRTPRTEVMFGPAGFAYVYLIYGMYNCFNIVTGNVGYPAAVLIRGVYLINSKRLAHGFRPWVQDQIISGPGKVCRELKIDKSLNKENLLKSKKLQVIEDEKLLKKICPNGFKIKKTSRVGVDYAEIYKNKPWRYILK